MRGTGKSRRRLRRATGPVTDRAAELRRVRLRRELREQRGAGHRLRETRPVREDRGQRPGEEIIVGGAILSQRAHVETLVPGEPELRMREERLQTGVPLPQETWRSLLDAARLAGMTAQWLEATAALAKLPHA